MGQYSAVINVKIQWC